MISVVIPTIAGREHWLEQARAAYLRTCADCELITVKDHPNVGEAWNAGLLLVDPDADYVHLTADDLEPHDGWWQAAVEACKRGLLPAPRVLNPDGSLQSCGGAVEQDDWSATEFTRIPFLSREQLEHVGTFPSIHYYSDNWVSYRCGLAGVGTVVIRDYLFTHHNAQEGRVDYRFGEDGATFARLTG